MQHCSNLSSLRSSPLIAGLTFKSVLIKQPLKVTLALFASSGWDGDRDPLLNQTMHPSDSEVVIRDYYMSNERYGTAYITPNYDGKGYRGELAEIDLETAKYNRVRLHGIETDFSDYYSVSTTSLDGIDPYVAESSSNKEDQVMVKVRESEERSDELRRRTCTGH